MPNKSLIVALSLFMVGCGSSSESTESNKKPPVLVETPIPFDQLVFEIIKSNDESRLELITVTPEQEKTYRENAKMKLDDGLAEHSMKMAKMSLKLLHEETAKKNFAWNEAKLVKTRCRRMAANQPELVDYSPDLELSEIYLVVESNGQTIGIHLDDCVTIEPGVHAIGDGFRLMSESKMNRLAED